MSAYLYVPTTYLVRLCTPNTPDNPLTYILTALHPHHEYQIAHFRLHSCFMKVFDKLAQDSGVIVFDDSHNRSLLGNLPQQRCGDSSVFNPLF
jgi:hypothetical protein